MKFLCYSTKYILIADKKREFKSFFYFPLINIPEFCHVLQNNTPVNTEKYWIYVILCNLSSFIPHVP